MAGTRKYLIAFVITALIFATAIYVSNKLADKKLQSVKDVEDKVSLDILNSETQYSLLSETSCKDIGPGFLSQELGPLGDRLSYAENNSQFNQGDLDSLKRTYFLLEIKDYLLMKQLTAKCNIRPTFILYFYSGNEQCPDCDKMGYVLTALRDKYPALRVYSFDYSFDLGAIKTLTDIYKIKPDLPAVIVNSTPYYGFKTIDEFEKDVPALKLLKTATSTATSTSDIL